MSDVPQATPAESEPVLTERERLEKVHADLGQCIVVTAAKSDVDRLTTVRDYLRDTLWPPPPPEVPIPPPPEDPPAGRRK